MYIAFRWLISISMVMWVSICCLDHFVLKKIQRFIKFAVREFVEVPVKNQTHFSQEYRKVNRTNYFVYHYAMFVAGGLVVALFNNKTRIYYYSRNKLVKLKIPDFDKKLKAFLIDCLNGIWQLCTVSNIMGALHCVSEKYHLREIWLIFKDRLNLMYLGIPKQSEMEITEIYDEKTALDQKLKLVLDERKGLVKVLTDVMRENSSMKVKFQLVIMAKERLTRRLEEYENNLRNMRAQQSTFQYLYMATCQKNIFLRALVEKLSKEKRTAEQNLAEIVNEIYSTKNSQLKKFCSKFIVGSANSIMRRDMNAEVNKFLENSGQTLSIESSQPPTDIAQTSTTTITNRQKDDPIYSKHKVAGTKGDYIVTVKDREGLIEKMYEYNNNSSEDTGDTIKSIRREYSVFHDRDCIVEFKYPTSDEASSSSRNTSTGFTPRRNFLTQSPAFQEFLKSTHLQVVPRRHHHHHHNYHHHYECHCHCAVNAY